MTPAPDRRCLQLVLVDEDPVFRAGLRICLEQTADLRVLAEAADGATALQMLANLQAQPVDRSLPQLAPEIQPGVDLVVVDVGLGRTDRPEMQGLELCRRIRAQYPTVAVLVLSALPEPILLSAAQRVGANGYGAKNLEANELIAIIRRVATGQPYWIRLDRPLVSQSGLPDASASQTPLRPAPRQPFALLRRRLRLSGLEQIDAELGRITAQLRSLDLTDLDRALLSGRQRELRAARWVVNRLLATPTLASSPEQALGTPSPAATDALISRDVDQPQSSSPLARSSPSALVSQSSAPLAPVNNRDVGSLLFDAISAKLQTGLSNGTTMPMETDILREDKKRELFYLVLRKLEDLLDEVRFSQLTSDQLESKRSLLLLDLWQMTVIDFFGKYSTITIDGFAIEIADEILQEMAIVQAELLDKIPSVVELWQHLLFQTPLVVDSAPYPPGNPESLARAEMLLENLMIQVANAVMQPLLNRFANVETIKQTLYDRRLLSTREIERFRNDLSWRYRLERYVREPTNMFESQYSLMVLSGRGIKQTKIYAPRNQELQQLSGIPLMVTLVLETRDAVAPRVQTAVSLLGNGVIYVLTEVIGRGIGLIGRGVIKGIGNVWQDGRFNRR